MPFKKSTTPLPEPALFDYAIAALTRRMRSERDLRRLLLARAEPHDLQAVDRILLRLRDLRYLSDQRFAQDFTRIRQEGQHFGPRRVSQDLHARGISKDLITQTLENAYAETDEVALAQQFCDRKRIQPPTNPKETNRLLGRLTRAGFSSQTIWKLLRTWNTPIEAEPPETEDA